MAEMGGNKPQSGLLAGAGEQPAALRAMLTYNALIALYLANPGTAGHLKGLLLWPAVVLYAAVALLLVGKWRER